MIPRGITFLLFAGLAATACAREVIPPSPAAHFNDYAGIVSPATSSALDSKLEQFERTTSDQIVVAIYPRMESDSSIEDYTVRIAQSWHAGLKGRDNGAVLFVFVKNHTMYLQVGYGLEGALPDALAKRIIADEITPRFKAGDYDGGLTAGVNAILAATRGEYRGTGHTVASRKGQGLPGWAIFLIILVVMLLSVLRRASSVYGGGGMNGFGGGVLAGMLLGGGGGGGCGGGGGFSGGGGGFGGGGAGGSW